MSVVTARADAPCPGHPEGVHGWAIFEGGKGCHYCEAWVPWKRVRPEDIDPLPTSVIQRPVAASSTYGADVDLDLEVMNDLLEVSRADVSFGELEAMARRIIERVRATAP